MPWAYLVVDEAHRLKNAAGKARSIVDALRYEHLTLLTGTPVQNSTAELFSLLSLLAPRKFADADAFEAKYGSGPMGGQRAAELQGLLAPYMLRRLKEHVIKDEMPPKEETVVPIELSPPQRAAYRQLLLKHGAALLHSGGGASASAAAANPKGDTSMQTILLQLRKLCNHPHLLQKGPWPLPPLENAGLVAASLERLVDASGKMQLLHKLLPRLRAEGRKVLVFSQMGRMLDLLQVRGHARRARTMRMRRVHPPEPCMLERCRRTTSTWRATPTSASTAPSHRRSGRPPSTASRRAAPPPPSSSSSRPRRAASAST